MKTKILGEGGSILLIGFVILLPLSMFDRNVIYKNEALEVQIQLFFQGWRILLEGRITKLKKNKI